MINEVSSNQANILPTNAQNGVSQNQAVVATSTEFNQLLASTRSTGGNRAGSTEPRQPTLNDSKNAPYARMAQDSYQLENSGDLTPEGFQRIDVQDNTDSGMAAAAYYNADSNELVIAYRGTEPTTTQDLAADAQLFRGKSNPQAEDANNYAERIQQMAAEQGLDVDNITYTGHSLGGALATEVSALRQLTEGEENSAIVFEGPGSQKSLEQNLGRELSAQELDQVQESQVNYRTNTPISGPNNPVSNTRHHTSELVNLNMERTPSDSPLEEIRRHIPAPGPAVVNFLQYSLEQHDIGRIADIMEQSRWIGLDQEASAAEANRFKDAFEARIEPSNNLFDKFENLQLRNEYIPLKNIHGDDVNVRVDNGGNIRFERGGAGLFENIEPERFNIDLNDPHNQEQLMLSGLNVEL